MPYIPYIPYISYIYIYIIVGLLLLLVPFNWAGESAPHINVLCRALIHSASSIQSGLVVATAGLARATAMSMHLVAEALHTSPLPTPN